MFVVRTIPQLQEAAECSVREVMVVGGLALKIVENRDGHSGDDGALNGLFADFSVHAVRDSNENIIAAVFQQRKEGE